MEDENAFDQSNEARIELIVNFLSAINVNRYSIFHCCSFLSFSFPSNTVIFYIERDLMWLKYL